MITHSLDVVLSKPGVWMVCGGIGILLIEVEADGTCHQLNPRTFERDGVLSREGWRASAHRLFVGPLARRP